ncbi:serine/threonine-protein kinase [Ideonella sp. DXS29W]|uniref:Serine/threonine-protein kinase n=1 Tax=Ideonella lacteola TaxID=2984193 RepID=A0ABU9BHM0_9BURK
MNLPDRQRWQLLSPLLDELLDASPERRALRLAELSAEQPALAEELVSLLGSQQQADDARFLDGTAGAPTSTLAGQRLGPYTLVAPLGQGGTGSVWRAARHDGRFDAQVAIKLLHLSLVGHAAAQRFRREGLILARLTHPNIARLLDAGVSESGQPYLVLEWVDGERLDQYCDSKRLTFQQRLVLLDEVLKAVSHAHSHLVIHRDLKPTNILVDREGRVKLLDFGIGKILEAEEWRAGATAITREVGGQSLTPEYAAPEQWSGEPATTATDVYALGVLMYRLLCGQHPTAAEGASIQQIMRSTLETEPAVLSSHATAEQAALRGTTAGALSRGLRSDLSNIAAKALAKLPSQRYATVDAFAEDLRRYRDHEPVVAQRRSWIYRWGKFARRHRVAVGAASLSTMAILAGLVGTVSQARVAEKERDRALSQLEQTEAVEEFLAFLVSSTSNKPVSAIELLERARGFANAQLGDNPAVTARLQLDLAGIYSELEMSEATAEALARASTAAQQSGDLALQLQAECAQASEIGIETDADRAAARFERAMDMLKQNHGDAVGLAFCHHLRAMRAFELGDNRLALADEREALRLMEGARSSTRSLQIAMRQGVAGALAKTGDIAGALQEIQAAIDATAAMGRSHSIRMLTFRNNQGVLLARAGNPMKALAAFDSALEDLHDGESGGGAPALANRARALLDMGRYDEAQASLDKSLALSAQLGDERSPPFSITIFGWCPPGELRACERRIESARDALAGFLPPHHPSLAYADVNHARMLLEAGEAQRAKPLLERALSIYGEPKRGEQGRIRALGMLSLAELQLGHTPIALAHAEQAVQQARSALQGFDHSEWLGGALLAQGRAMRAAGDARAEPTLKEALAQLEPTAGERAPSVLEAKALLTALQTDASK